MKIHELKYNLYLVNFSDVEREILISIKSELDKFGVLSYEDIPRSDYLKLINYFTLSVICKTYANLPHKKNTIFYIIEKETNLDILKFVKEIKKYFPFLLYITELQYTSNDPAVHTEITLRLKEFRYEIDYSKYSFNKIKKFCKVNQLENLILDFKL